MTTKIWRGDAQAVAQVTHVTPDEVEIGDTFTLTMNGKSITVTAEAATAENVVDLLEAAIGASDIAEFGDVVASTDVDILVLTAAEPGVPFTVTGSSSNGGTGGVDITTTVQGSGSVSASNQTQQFRIPLTAAGTFTVAIGGYVTTGIAVGASAATVQAAIEALTSIGAGNASVALATDANDSIYTMSVIGALAGTNVATLFATITSTKIIVRTLQDGSDTLELFEIQELTYSEDTIAPGTTFTLSFNGISTSAIDANDHTEDSVGAALSILAAIDYVITGMVDDTHMQIQFLGSSASWNQSQLVASTLSGGATITVTVYPIVVDAVAATGPVNEVQVVTLSTVPTGGTFTLTFSGQTTGSIAYNASAATVDTALEALSNIGAGDVVVTGSAGGPYTVTFGTAMAGANQPQMTGNGSGLTGGTVQGLTVAEFVASSGPNHWDTAANWFPAGVPVNADDVKFELGNSDCLYGLLQTAVTLASLHVAMTYRGKIGLPRVNANEYFEYRTFELTIGATNILLGHGDGSGSGKIAINTGTVQTALVVRDSGGSADFGVAAITWRGIHISNTLQIRGGEFGTCPYSDQAATIDSLEQLGGSVALKHTNILGSLTVSSNHTAYECVHAGEVYST